MTTVDSGTQSIHTAVRVVELVGHRGPIGVSELARTLDLPKSTAQRTLHTLRAAGWLRQATGGRWSLTLRCAAVGRGLLSEEALRAAARPLLIELRDRTHETTRWFLIEGESLVVVDGAESDHAVRAVESELALPVPLHATAVGKALLARWPRAQVDAALGSSLAAVTPKTITSLDALHVDLDRIRTRGWGEVREELYLDVGGVAAVAPVNDDTAVGIGVSYPLHRSSATTIRSYGALVADAAERLATLTASSL